MKNYLENQEPIERETERSRFNRAINRISLLSIPVLLLIGGIKIREDYLSEPISAQYANLNGDNKKDLIVKTRGGETYGLVQKANGEYKLFDCEEREAVKKEAKLQAYLKNNFPFSDEDL